MATGTNTATYQNTSVYHSDLIGRDEIKQHPIEAIDGLVDRLNTIDNNINTINTDFLTQISTLVGHLNELLDSKKFADEYKLITQDVYDTDIPSIKSQLVRINEIVETWDDSVNSPFETLEIEVSGLKAQLAPFIAQIGGYAAEVQGFSATASSLSADLEALKLLVDNLSKQTTTTADIVQQIEDIKVELDQGGAIDDDLTSRISQLEELTNTYLPHTEGEGSEAVEVAGSLRDEIAEVSNSIPAALSITKTYPDVACTKSTDDEGFLDYTFDFTRPATDAEKTTNPEAVDISVINAEFKLTADIKAYIEHMQSSYNATISGLQKKLKSLTCFVCALKNHHKLDINNISIYKVQPHHNDVATKTHINWISTVVDGDSSLLSSDFPTTALLSTAMQTPESLRGSNFYIIFETTYPILDESTTEVSAPIQLAFPDFASTNRTVYKFTTAEGASSDFYCTPYGIPGVSKALYVLHAGIYNDTNGNKSYLTPFTIGTEESDGTFLNNFADRGEFPFMLQVTDPSDAENRTSKGITIKADYYCYFGTSTKANLDTAADTANFTAVTDLTAPAAYLNWSKFNKNRSQYYYYMVPTASLYTYKNAKGDEIADPDETGWLRFETNIGTGGWELKQTGFNLLDNAEVPYTVFRSTNALTFCPPTTIWIAEPTEEQLRGEVEDAN